MQATGTLFDAVLAFASLERDALERRWQLYGRLRRDAPAFPFANTVFVTRHGDCQELLLDRERVINDSPSRGVPPDVLARLTASERTMLDDVIDWEQRWLTSVNGDRHVGLRGLAQRVFAPRAIDDMHARATEVAERMLDRLAGRDEVDFVGEFAYKLPLTVIAEILDIPEELREPLHETTNGMRVARTGIAWRMQLPRGLEQAHFHFMEMRRQVLALFAHCRAKPTSTPIMQNILNALDAGADEDDMVVLTQLLITAGHRTTTDLLATSLHTLLSDRARWQRLGDDPDATPRTVEECLRFRSPAQDVERFADADFELHGVPIRRGQHLSITVGAANHDETVFAHPDEFDIDRPELRSHLAFGKGAHFCLGGALARLEGDVVLRAMSRRFPNVSLADQVPHWTATTHLLGLERLRVRIGRHRD